MFLDRLSLSENKGQLVRRTLKTQNTNAITNIRTYVIKKEPLDGYIIRINRFIWPAIYKFAHCHWDEELGLTLEGHSFLINI